MHIIDAYSVKPIDRETLQQAAKDTGGKLIVAEDHWPEGGLGDAVLEAFTGPHAAAADGAEAGSTQDARLRNSGELLAAAGIDADHIVQAVKSLVQEKLNLTQRRKGRVVRGSILCVLASLREVFLDSWRRRSCASWSSTPAVRP